MNGSTRRSWGWLRSFASSFGWRSRRPAPTVRSTSASFEEQAISFAFALAVRRFRGVRVEAPRAPASPAAPDLILSQRRTGARFLACIRSGKITRGVVDELRAIREAARVLPEDFVLVARSSPPAEVTEALRDEPIETWIVDDPRDVSVRLAPVMERLSRGAA